MSFSALIARDLVRVYGDRRVLDGVSLAASPGQRIGLVGENGVGKSTLHVAQDVAFAKPHQTAEQVYRAAVGDRVPLADLGLLAGRALTTEVGALSVGQRRRLALAMLVAAAPQVLLLDEPTNHISLTLAEELEDALRSAPGAIVVASHDRWLRRRWVGTELRLVPGRAATLQT